MPIWEQLLERALRQIKAAKLPDSSWRFGGGTVLMLEYNHRTSKDIDIFISDPQYLTALSPRLNDALEAELGRYTEQSNFVRLHFPEGEIDFICAPQVTDMPPKESLLLGKNIQMEHPIEIVAKKINYRGDEFKPRDVFDLAMTFHKDKCGILEKSEFFTSHKTVLAERIDSLEKSGKLQNLSDHLEVLPGGKEISGREYHLCKLFLWNLDQLSQKREHETDRKHQRGVHL